MASDAPLIGLNAPLRNHCLAVEILVPFLHVGLPICAVIKECALKKSGLAFKLAKFKGEGNPDVLFSVIVLIKSKTTITLI